MPETAALVPSMDSNDYKETTIQIRLPSGEIIRNTFDAEMDLTDVCLWIESTNHRLTPFSLLQPFPRHEMSYEDMTTSLADLGLVPSGSLILYRSTGATNGAIHNATKVKDTREETESADSSISAGPVENEDNKETSIQIRLPSGEIIRYTFAIEETLADICRWIQMTKPEFASYTLLQPFPRREMTRDDMDVSLADLGLVPSGSLVLTQVKRTRFSSFIRCIFFCFSKKEFTISH